MGFYSDLMGFYGGFMGFYSDIPSGDVKIAIENGHLVRGFSHKKWGFSIAMLNYQRVSQGFFPMKCLLLRRFFDG